MHSPIILMGVSGSGKTTIGELLEDHTGAPFLDGDDYHPQANIDKMASGQPLNDADRQPWLERLRQLLEENDDPIIIACSALKKSYRDFLRTADHSPIFIYLCGERDVLLERLNSRENHFFSASMLDSQLDTLQSPNPASPDMHILSITDSPESIVQQIKEINQ